MLVYLNNKSGSYYATAEYNSETKETVVLKGSTISSKISQGKFRSAKSIEKVRSSGCVKNGMLVDNVRFKSPSSAANFVTGTSTNGMLAWKDETGISLKKLT